MRCRVNLMRLNIPLPDYYSDSDDAEESDFAHINNTTKEKIARPLSKRKSKPNSAPNTPLPKIRSAKSLLDKDEDEANTLKVLERCRNCRVVLVDCMKGDLMKLYARSLSPSESNSEPEEQIKKHKKRKKKKHKHKSDKAKVCTHFITIELIVN